MKSKCLSLPLNSPLSTNQRKKVSKNTVVVSEIYFFCLCGLCWLHLLVFFSLVMTIGNIICDKCLHERPAWNTHPQKRKKTQTFRGIFLSRVYKIRVYANHIESKWTKNNGLYYRMQKVLWIQNMKSIITILTKYYKF